jgi:type VI secretion system secreted protein VgrG
MPDDAFGTAPVSGTVTPCPKAKPSHWLEIELLDDAGQPVGGEEFKVVLPDGEVIRGFLDDKGSERIAPVTDAGNCRVSFPAIDGRDWKPDGGHPT